MMVEMVPVRAMEMALKAPASGSSEARAAVPSPCALAPIDSPLVTGLVMDSLFIIAAPKFDPTRPDRDAPECRDVRQDVSSLRG